MQTTTISGLRAHIKHYVDSVIESNDIVVVNRGDTGAVLLSLDQYNAIKGTEAILSSPGLASSVRQGLQQAAEGRGVEVSLDEL
jgi:antitoxin YefM